MSPAHVRPAVASFRDKVTELIEAGEPFGHVEDAINAHLGLTEDQKAALWLFAFSLHDRSEQQRQGRALLTVVGEAGGEGSEAKSGKARATDRARPQDYDANGFPLPQRNRSFLDRVARLLNPQ